MTTRITLWRTLFGEHPQVLLENSDFTVTAFRYASGGRAKGAEQSWSSGDSALDGADDLGCPV